MAMTGLQQNRMIRRVAMREQLSVQCHYQHLIDALEGMSELAEGEIDQDSRDRFSMLSVIADKHWRVVDKYLPLFPASPAHQSPSGSAQSALQRAIGQLAQAHSTRAHTAHNRTYERRSWSTRGWQRIMMITGMQALVDAQLVNLLMANQSSGQ